MKEKNKKEQKQTEKEKETKEEQSEEELLKKLDEDLTSIIEERKKREHPLFLYFNLGLHRNYFLHLFLMFLTNVITLSAVIGLIGYGVLNDIAYYFFSILLFTLLETNFKTLTFRFLPKLVVTSFGAINLVYLIPLYYVTINLIGKVVFGGLLKYVIVFSVFLILRLVVMHYIKRITYRR